MSKINVEQTRWSGNQAEKVCGVGKGSVTKLIKKDNPIGELIRSKKRVCIKGCNQFNIDRECMEHLLHYFAFTSKVKSKIAEQNYYLIKGIDPLIKTNSKGNPPKNTDEKDLQLYFDSENTEFEVQCNMGRIDILTLTHIVEVKKMAYKHYALGQILSYKYYYPNHIPALVIYGSRKNKLHQLKEFKLICNSLGVELYIIENEQDKIEAKLKLTGSKQMDGWLLDVDL